MNQINIDRLALLDETKDFYSEDPSRRAFIENKGCAYITAEGKCCAIGRRLPPKKAKELESKYPGEGLNIVFRFLPQDLTRLGERFLLSIQTFHDNKSNWLSTGLSKDGLDHYAKIKEGIESGYYDVEP